jgi:hypothetical protein
MSLVAVALASAAVAIWAVEWTSWRSGRPSSDTGACSRSQRPRWPRRSSSTASGSSPSGPRAPSRSPLVEIAAERRFQLGAAVYLLLAFALTFGEEAPGDLLSASRHPAHGVLALAALTLATFLAARLARPPQAPARDVVDSSLGALQPKLSSTGSWLAAAFALYGVSLLHPPDRGVDRAARRRDQLPERPHGGQRAVGRPSGSRCSTSASAAAARRSHRRAGALRHQPPEALPLRPHG